MAADLAGTPTPGLRVQLRGETHLANFGAFASPERRLVFDVNDFDETLPGPSGWDVKRLAASVAGQLRSRPVARQSRWPAGPPISSAATATSARPMSCTSSAPLPGLPV
jgi:predicted NAD/FAD-binding protein